MTAMPMEEPLSQDVISELIGCDDPEALSGCLMGRPDLIQPAVVEELAELVSQRVRVDLQEALRLAEAALAIAQVLCDAECLGRGFRAKANALWFKGNCRKAVELFATAAAHFEQAGRTGEVGRTLSSSIQSLTLLGEYDRAFQAAARAREIFLRLDDRRRLARLELNVANIHHRQDRFAEALSSYERAYEELLPYRDAEALAGALHNMAVCLIMLNEFNRALSCYQQARELCKRELMPLMAVQADYNIGYLYFLRGDYQKAIESLCNTRQLCRTNGDAYHAALCDLDESEIYLELNLTAEAARMAREAMQQFQKQGMAHEQGRSIANLAIATHRQDDISRSLELFAQAQIIFTKENNQAWLALIELYQALALFENGEFGQAQGFCRRALKFFEESGLDRRAILCYLLLAHISLQSGCEEDARQYCDRVLRNAALREAPLLRYHVNLLVGHVQRGAGQWLPAYESYSKARLELETLRSSLQGEELKIAFLKNKQDVYESLVRVCLGRSSNTANEEAFNHIEQAKSRSLTELLSRGAPHIHGLRDERLEALRAELNWFYHRLDVEQTRPEGISLERIHRLRAEACIREQDLLHLVRTLPGRSESNGVLQTAGAMTLKQIQAALPEDAALLEYFQMGPQFVAAVVTREDLRITPLAVSSQVTRHIHMLEFQLSKFRLTEAYTRTFEADLRSATEERLRELYRNLVAPLASELKCRHLIVAPHGVLHYVPFHALSDAGEYLIDRFTVSFAPSGSIYAMCQRKPATSGTRSLLLGVTDRNAPWIRREIRSVAAVVPEPDVVLGRRATVDVLRTAGAGSRIIHIATHGYFRQDNPAFSSVRLADSYLSFYDLYQLTLPVELLTLSGCGTGLNVIAAGDELLGLTRGLLCAGAHALLLTLWDVHDHTTAEFMASFYGHLQLLQDKSLALRSAMLDLRKRYPHPYYWAPFVLIGKAGGYSA